MTTRDHVPNVTLDLDLRQKVGLSQRTFSSRLITLNFVFSYVELNAITF